MNNNYENQNYYDDFEYNEFQGYDNSRDFRRGPRPRSSQLDRSTRFNEQPFGEGRSFVGNQSLSYGNQGSRNFNQANYSGMNQQGQNRGQGSQSWQVGQNLQGRGGNYPRQNYAGSYDKWENPYGTGYGETGYMNRPGSSSDTGFYGENRNNFRGRGPKNFKISPDTIAMEVNRALYESPELDATDIDVNVEEDGTVRLSGTVENRSAKRLAEDIAENAFGVKDVLNELKISSSQGGMTGSMSRGEDTSSNFGSGTGSQKGFSGNQNTKTSAGTGSSSSNQQSNQKSKNS